MAGRGKFWAGGALAACLPLCLAAMAHAATGEDCDRLAADPHDAKRAAPAVSDDRLEAGPAVIACQAAVSRAPGEQRLLHQLGRALERSGRDEEARAAYRAAAAEGYAPAQYRLGLLLERRWDLGQSGRSWLEMAAAEGLAAAARERAKMDAPYSTPDGWNRAVELLSGAAASGDLEAKASLGRILLESWAPAERRPEARRLLEEAAQAGNARASYFLGYVDELGLSGPVDARAAERRYEEAGRRGFARGWIAAGNLALSGSDEDSPRAVERFRQAAELGDAAGQTALGFCLFLGMGAPQDFAEAVRLFAEASRRGDAVARNNLGFATYYGRGVPQDRLRALELFYEADALGEGSSLANVGASGLLTDEQKSKMGNEARRRVTRASRPSFEDRLERPYGDEPHPHLLLLKGARRR